jgi:site-specific recombinase XerD
MVRDAGIEAGMQQRIKPIMFRHTFATYAADNFKKIVKLAGPLSMDKVVPHTLRHAFASHAVDGGGDILVLKTILGHASIKTTELYVHPSMAVLRAAVNNHIAPDILSELLTP